MKSSKWREVRVFVYKREREGDREIDMDGNGMMGYRELDIYAGNDER